MPAPTTMPFDHQLRDRANMLATELVDICHAAGNPLAADFVQAAVDYLNDPAAFIDFPERAPDVDGERSLDS